MRQFLSFISYIIVKKNCPLPIKSWFPPTRILTINIIASQSRFTIENLAEKRDIELQKVKCTISSCTNEWS